MFPYVWGFKNLFIVFKIEFYTCGILSTKLSEPSEDKIHTFIYTHYIGFLWRPSRTRTRPRSHSWWGGGPDYRPDWHQDQGFEETARTRLQSRQGFSSPPTTTNQQAPFRTRKGFGCPEEAQTARVRPRKEGIRYRRSFGFPVSHPLHCLGLRKEEKKARRRGRQLRHLYATTTICACV